MKARNDPVRVVRGIALVFLLQSAATGAMLPFVVLWAHRAAGLAGAAAGLLFVVQAVGEFGAGLLGGTLADRFGHRRLLLISTVGMTVGYGLLGVGSAPAAAITLFLAAGVFESAFHPNLFALVGDVTADEDLPHAFSVVRVGANVGSVVGPLLGALAALASLSAVFAVTGGLLALAVLATAALVPGGLQPLPDDDDEPELPRGTVSALVHDRRLAALVLAGGLLAVSITWWEADGLVLVRAQHPLSASAYAALFTVAAAVAIVAQLPVTRLLRHARTGPVLIGGAMVQAVGLGLLCFAGLGYGVLIAAVVLLALGELAYGPTLHSYVSRRAGRSRQASYQAAMSITQDIGTAVGPASGLGLGSALGAKAVWAVGALACAVAGVASGARSRSGGDPATSKPNPPNPPNAPDSSDRSVASAA